MFKKVFKRSEIKVHPPTFLMFLIVLLFSTTLSASDLAKEKRWASQVEDALLDGEAVYLNDGKSDFLAIETRAEDPKDVGIIIMHGIGIHPDWETIIRPLRVELAEAGWNTLSLQMPILSNDATGEDYAPLMKEVPARIDAGIRQLFKNGAKKIVLVAHSLGTSMTNYYLTHKKIYKEAQTETPIVAYIAIGMGAGSEAALQKMTLPIHDLYGEKDLPNIVASAAARKVAAKHNKHYTQQKVAGANHFFEDQDEDLVKAVKRALAAFK